MKLVQLIRPLFLTAIGLHALMLFVPIGPSETAVIEDVDLTELPAKTPETSPSGPLPVPDPNAKTGGPTAASTATTATRRPPAKTASSTSARTTPATTSRAAAVRTRTPATPSGSRSTASTSSANSARRGSASSSSGGATASGSTASGSSAAATARNTGTASNNQSTNYIATLEAETPDSGANTSNAAASGSTSSERTTSSRDANNAALSIAALLSTVTQDVPDSLRSLASELDRSLAYSAKNTNDESVQQAREAWKSDVQRQANIGLIERMAPTEIDELTQVDYPIEVSNQPEGRALSVCLPKDPHMAEIGVLFDARGNVVGEPEVIRSTGYPALNEEIKATVAAYDDFPSDRASKAYTFEVEVFYDSDACVSLEALKE